MLAAVLAKRKEPPKSLLDLWKPALIVGIPWLIIMLQPDLGTGIVFIGIFFGMLYWSGVAWPLLLLLASPVVSLVLSFSTGHVGRVVPRAARTHSVLPAVSHRRNRSARGEHRHGRDRADSLGEAQAISAEPPQGFHRSVGGSKSVRLSRDSVEDRDRIGRSCSGKGFTLGTQKRLAFLPEQHTDFIFAVVGEEMGFIGVTVALTLFLVLFLRITQIAGRANDSYSSLVAFGLMASWFVHVLVNVGMTLNLMPITGIPLPFFSYGGSFMLASWLAIGVLMRISGEGRGKAAFKAS